MSAAPSAKVGARSRSGESRGTQGAVMATPKAKSRMAGVTRTKEYAAMQREMDAMAREMEELVESGASERRPAWRT